MGRAGDCNVCYHRMRRQIDEAHALGEGTRSIARRFNIPEANARRHFGRCLPVRRAAPKPEPQTSEPTGPTYTREQVEKIAAELEIPFVEMLGHVVYCLKGDVSTATDEEACELVTLLEGHPHEHV